MYVHICYKRSGQWTTLVVLYYHCRSSDDDSLFLSTDLAMYVSKNSNSSKSVFSTARRDINTNSSEIEDNNTHRYKLQHYGGTFELISS